MCGLQEFTAPQSPISALRKACNPRLSRRRGSRSSLSTRAPRISRSPSLPPKHRELLKKKKWTNSNRLKSRYKISLRLLRQSLSRHLVDIRCLWPPKKLKMTSTRSPCRSRTPTPPAKSTSMSRTRPSKEKPLRGHRLSLDSHLGSPSPSNLSKILNKTSRGQTRFKVAAHPNSSNSSQRSIMQASARTKSVRPRCHSICTILAT